MTKSNAKSVTATMSCDKKDFKCTITMEGGSEMYFHGAHGVNMFLNMLDVFYFEDDEEGEEDDQLH